MSDEDLFYTPGSIYNRPTDDKLPKSASNPFASMSHDQTISIKKLVVTAYELGATIKLEALSPHVDIGTSFSTLRRECQLLDELYIHDHGVLIDEFSEILIHIRYRITHNL